VRLNEFYGQTEANLLVGSCSAWPGAAGAMGLPYPGHDVQLIERRGLPARRGEPRRLPRLLAQRGRHRGEGARRLAADRRPGERGRGRLPHLRRPRRRPDLQRRIPDRAGRGRGLPDPAPVGRPRGRDRRADPERGQIVKAFVVPAAGVDASDALAAELQAFVPRAPRRVRVPARDPFVESLPTTVTGKDRRGSCGASRARSQQRGRRPSRPALSAVRARGRSRMVAVSRGGSVSAVCRATLRVMGRWQALLVLLALVERAVPRITVTRSSPALPSAGPRCWVSAPIGGGRMAHA